MTLVLLTVASRAECRSEPVGEETRCSRIRPLRGREAAISCLSMARSWRRAAVECVVLSHVAKTARSGDVLGDGGTADVLDAGCAADVRVQALANVDGDL